MRSGPALPFFPLPLVDIADRIHSLLNTLLKPFRCPPDRSSDALPIAQRTFCRRPPDTLPPGSSAGIEGSDGDNNAKVTHSTRLSKFRDKFYRQNIDNRRPGDAASGEEGLLPARRLAETAFRRHETRKGSAPTPRIPALTEFRRAATRHSGTAAHRNRKTQRSRSTGTARHGNRKTQRSRGSGTARHGNREAQGGTEHKGARSTRGSEHWGHSEDAPSPHASRRQRAFASQ